MVVERLVAVRGLGLGLGKVHVLALCLHVLDQRLSCRVEFERVLLHMYARLFVSASRRALQLLLRRRTNAAPD